MQAKGVERDYGQSASILTNTYRCAPSSQRCARTIALLSRCIEEGRSDVAHLLRRGSAPWGGGGGGVLSQFIPNAKSH